MGGSGSGNHYHWWRGSKKTTVEDCRRLDANHWMREGILKAGVWNGGSWAWFRDEAKTEQTASLGYEANTRDSPLWVRLYYTVTKTGEAVDYCVGLVTTRPPFGGLRWWVRCPLAVNGQACGRRVAKLYLRGRYFGCRHCHGLTYTSCQVHDKRVDALFRNPEALDAILDGPETAPLGSILLALKAERKAVKNLERGRFPG